MFVMTRREGEAIVINTTDGEIILSLEQIQGSQAKVGIKAPESVLVLREELLTAE